MCISTGPVVPDVMFSRFQGNISNTERKGRGGLECKKPLHKLQLKFKCTSMFECKQISSLKKMCIPTGDSVYKDYTSN